MLGPDHDEVVNTPNRPRSNGTSRGTAEALGGESRLERVLERLRLGVGRRYPGEPVTHWQHALQTAALARDARASDALVTAALLHDIGHLEDEIVDTASSVQGRDDRHEARGARLLADMFGPDVTEPIRLHVLAKRYLVSSSATYAAKLSIDSQRSLVLQGGSMTDEELEAFGATPYATDALRLRCWDDLAKDPSAPTPTLESFSGVLRRSLRSNADPVSST